MARTRPSTGLAWKSIPVYVGGALDTKTNPKLVQPGALLELENMYQLKTGELRLRNGFAALAATRALSSADNLFVTAQGGLATIARKWLGGAPPLNPYATALKYGSGGQSAESGWESNRAFVVRPYPVTKCAISGIEAAATGAVAVDLTDGDVAIAGGLQQNTWLETTGNNGIRMVIKDATTGKIVSIAASGMPGASNGRPAVSANGGSSFLCSFYCDNSGTPSLMASVFNLSSGAFSALTTVVLNGVDAAQPWIDAKPIPGGNLIAVAYRSSAGGVAGVVFDPATRTVTVGPIGIVAGAAASMCLGWLDDSLATGNMYLATAGSSAGVVLRTMPATTLAVSAANIIDATATAGVRNITGHINTSATNYVVLWDRTGSSTVYDRIVAGRWTGSAAVANLAPSFSLYSRSVMLADGRYYVLGAYDSSVQPTYSLLGTDDYSGVAGTSAQCHVLSGEAGGRRAVVCSLTSAPIISGTNIVMAVARKRRIATSAGAAIQGRIIQLATFTNTIASLSRPRELGGTLFMPGGVLHRDDGKAQEISVFPFYPESPTGVASATGAMTAGGAYVWRIVWKRNDATGRVTRSAGSVPLAVTLGGGDGRVTLTIQNPRLPISDLVNCIGEIYRAGPAGAGASLYNLVGEVYADAVTGGDTLTFIDSMSDVTAALGEAAYFTGNTLENFPPPSHDLLEVCGNRVGVVSAEDSTEFWPSKEYKPGAGIGFNSDLRVRVTGDGAGGMTALAAMDGRWILFKSSAIYVISGDGPNDLGQGSFNTPQAVSRSVGTVLPGSVVSTPDGIMFQSSKGIYLLDRGLGLTYVGKEVEQYTLAANVVDASLATGFSTARFVMASGRMLEWDYHHKRWYTHQLRVGASTVVACANPATGWCYALADGTVLQETPGVYSDVIGSGTAIVPRISFPRLNLAGLNGYQRVRGFDVLGDVVGNHTISVDCEFDYSGAVTGTARTKAQTGTAGFQIEYNPPEGKGKSSSIRPVITTSVLAAGSGAFKLTGLNVWVGIKRGGNVPASNRLT